MGIKPLENGVITQSLKKMVKYQRHKFKKQAIKPYDEKQYLEYSNMLEKD